MADSPPPPNNRSVSIRQAVVWHVSIGRITKLSVVAHALDRMKARGVTQQDIIDALKNPKARSFPADIPHRGIEWRKSPRKLLHVVYDEISATERRIITAYWK
ncbi:MAG: DUF4258 domain-containing protein [Planctomycetes bacterium]|nr:DUF4258 domain-containing protein [Planctomycetota bacterium]